MLSRLIGMFENSRLLQLVVITACIQGGVIISQFLITPWVDPSVVGMVRSLETIIALVILAGSLGMQSIAIRDTAASNGTTDKNEVLRQVFLLVVIASIGVIACIYVANKFVWNSVMSSYVFTTCGLVLLTNLLRVTTGFAQGAKVIREIYFALMLVTGVSIVLHVVLTKFFGIEGWMTARYIGELLCLVAVWWKLRSYIFSALDFRLVNRRELMMTAKSGVTVNASLFVRLMVDSLPVLMLTAYHVKIDEIGFFGIALLSLSLGLLPLTIIAQRAIPDLVEVVNDKEMLRERHHAFFRSMLKISSSVALLLIVISLVWFLLVGGVYKQAAIYMFVLALTLPLKAIALVSGTMLLALRVFSLSLKVNIVEGLSVALILYLSIMPFGALAGVLGYATGVVLSSMLLLVAVRLRLADL